MTEKSYYADLTKYYIEYAKEIEKSIAWEAKFTRTNRLNFKCLAEHQEEKLLKSEMAYGEKIADAGLMKKPFDGWVLYKARSFFIAIYFLPRHTEVYEINIRDFLKEKYAGKEKSLSKERAGEIGRRIVI